MIIVEDIKENIQNLMQADNVKIPYGPDMFHTAIDTIAEYDMAIAVDEDGQSVALLKYQPSTYIHRYK